MSNRAAARSPTGQLPTGVRGRKVLARGRQYAKRPAAPSSACGDLTCAGWALGRGDAGGHGAAAGLGCPQTRGCRHPTPTGTTRKLCAVLRATSP